MKTKSLVYITISKCPPVKTSMEHATKAKAEAAMELINTHGCGSQCKGPRYHYTVIG